MVWFAFLFSVIGIAQNHSNKGNAMPTLKQIDSVIAKYKVSERHADQFGRLVIQDDAGRMKPINTFSSELLRKVSKSDSYKDMNSDQVFMSMSQFPTVWFEVPIIYLKRGNDSIRKILGIDKKAEYANFRAFFDDKGNYKLSPYLAEAYKTPTKTTLKKILLKPIKK